MEWIVNEAPPTLPRTYFSPEFCDFIDRWYYDLFVFIYIYFYLNFSLKKSTAERADLNTLLVWINFIQ
jgi:hypothetical protein